ncbi:hypothetical protein CesoFtcFv8_022737 [Champsocephalus esox]|uniref:Collagen alpha-1(XII) chain-like n=1 Tax=Champsocephalus esox TaxID=159716 RepID=A0AAN8GJ31_9TELE|nr:hypothetical protein CesoFtcFv8_022737 [Champsocephalus esox]
MIWSKPQSRIQGYRIQVTSDTEEPMREFSLPASASKTSISDLSPDVDYTVTISAYAGSEESLPISGQITLESTGGTSSKPDASDSVKCSVSAIADVVFLVDGSWSVGRPNFKFIQKFISVAAGAFQIGAERTRVGVVQFSSGSRTEFNLKTHLTRPTLLRAIAALEYKGGNTRTGDALDYLLTTSFSEASGARKAFPKVLVIITDGKSEDPVENYARQLRSRGVEIFVLGIQQASEEQMKLMASEPHRSHIFSVADFNLIKSVQNKLVSQVCAGVDDQLSSLVSGEEVVEPASNLQILEVASKSLRLMWDASIGEVSGYKIQMIPMMAGSKRQELHVGSTQTQVVVGDLSPDTEYQISLFALKGLMPSEPLTLMQKTQLVKVSLAKGSPRDLRVFEETVSSMKVSWEPAPGSVQQYRVSYQPSAGGPRKEVTVKGDNRAALLKNLQPGSQYEISVSARYPSGMSDALEGRGTTLEEVAPPKNLVTSDVTESSFKASWTASPGNVKMYQIRWKSLFSAEAGDKTVPGDETETVLEGLSPETLYQVSVIATSEQRDSEPLIGQETTDASVAGKSLAVSEETERSMRVSWTPAPGKVAHYRLKYSPIGGGKEMFLKVPGTSSSTVMKRLQPTTTYTITVNPIYKRGEGKARQGVGTTLSPYKAPRNLQTSEPTKTSFRVTWDPSPGEVKGYKVTFHPDGNDIDLGEHLVGPYDNTIVLEELRAGTKYSVAVFGMFDGGESVPLAGQENTTLMDDPDSPPVDTSDTKCKSTAKADLVLLVDGSWSIGRINFKTIRSFIARMVSVFNISPDRVQIALAQYSGDPKTEWNLNAHSTKASLLEAIAKLPYKGGNTMTGMALNFILQNNFKASAGMRENARKIGILITDGKSQDEIVFTSQSLRDNGIELYAVGVKNADEGELRSIASDPDDIHMYNVNDFKFLVDIVEELTVNLCNSVKGPGGELEAPSNLLTSEVTFSSFRATWTDPEGPVDMYRVTYRKVAAEEMLEVRGTSNAAEKITHRGRTVPGRVQEGVRRGDAGGERNIECC